MGTIGIAERVTFSKFESGSLNCLREQVEVQAEIANPSPSRISVNSELDLDFRT